jgi:hypothetical protein
MIDVYHNQRYGMDAVTRYTAGLAFTGLPGD